MEILIPIAASLTVIVVSSLRFSRWAIKREDELMGLALDKPAIIYRPVSPLWKRSPTESSDQPTYNACPLCGVLSVINGTAGVAQVPVSCHASGESCRETRPHLHAECLTCKSRFLTNPWNPP
jgi:hypothetical protein